MNNLFKKNLKQRAKANYMGNWIAVSSLFNIYDFIVDLRTQEMERELKLEPLFSTKEEFFNVWISVNREIQKHFNTHPNTIELTKKMKNLFNLIDLVSLKSIQNIAIVYRSNLYKQIVEDLTLYIIDFFKKLNIPVKAVKIKSDITGNIVYAIIPEMSENDNFIEQQLSFNNAIKEKLLNKTLEKIKQKGWSVIQEGEYLKILKGGKIVGYFTEDNVSKIYPTLEELYEGKKKKELIDKNYDKFTLGKDGELYTPKGTLISKIDFLSEIPLQESINEYEAYINSYNRKLKSYETKANNDPKTIQLGDHTLKVIKVFNKNITRPIIIEGPYKGIFLDQLVSASGKVLGSSSVASPYFTENKQVLESLGDTTEFSKKENLFTEQTVLEKVLRDHVNPNPTYLTKSYLEDLSYTREKLDTWVEDVKAKSDFIYEKKIKDRKQVAKKILAKMPLISGLSIISETNPNGTASVECKNINYGDEILITHQFIERNELGKGGTTVRRKIKLREDRSGKINTSIINDVFVTDACTHDGLGTKVLAQQVKSAVEIGCDFMETFAAKGSSMVGYYVWPKLGYNVEFTDDDDGWFSENITTLMLTFESWVKQKYPNSNLIEKFKDWLFKNTKYKKTGTFSIQDLYGCKVDGNFIGQEFWKEKGDSIELKFDLKPGSLSMRIFNNYLLLKAKKENIPIADFLNNDIKKYRSNFTNLECFFREDKALLKDYGGFILGISSAFLKSLRYAIANHDNGNLVTVFTYDPKRPSSYQKNLDTTMAEIKNKEPELYNQVKRLLQIHKVNYKMASNNQEDSLLRELDMQVLDQVWNDINKLYEAGSFK
jgi:hypothetical protein